MNWLSLLMRALQLAPVLVAGIEHIHGEAPGATKKQMAMDALALASGTAGVIAPEHAPAVAAATQLTSDVIDGVVSVYNAAGWNQAGGAAAAAAIPTLTPAPAPPAPAPPAPAADAPAPIAAVPSATPRTGD